MTESFKGMIGLFKLYNSLARPPTLKFLHIYFAEDLDRVKEQRNF